MEELDMKATCLCVWQSASLGPVGGLSRLHLPSGRSLGLKNGNGF